MLVVTNPEPEDAPGWARLAPMPDGRGEVASTAAGGKLVVAGGFGGFLYQTVTTVEALDVRSGQWERLPDLPAARHHAAAAALGGDVYVSGGAASVTNWDGQRSVWVLRSGASEWEPRAPLPDGRQGHRMRALGGRLYVVGGRGDVATLVYDPAADRWSRAPALPGARHHLALVVRDGELWAIGGRDEDQDVLDAVHVWRPGEQAWRDAPRLPRPVSAAVEGVLDDRIHLVGGEDPAVPGGGTIDQHLVFDPDAPRPAWRERPPPPLAVHGAAGDVLGGRLIVAGGSRRQGPLSSISRTDFAAAFAG